MVKKLHQQHFYTSVGQSIYLYVVPGKRGFGYVWMKKSKCRFIKNGQMFCQSFFSSSLLQKAVFFAQILQRQFTSGYVCCTFENVHFFLAYMPPWVKTRYPNSYLLLKKQLQGIFFMNLIHFIEILKCYRIRKNSKRSWSIVLILVGFL